MAPRPNGYQMVGGNWKTIQDEPHFKLRPRWASDTTERDMLAERRSRKD